EHTGRAPGRRHHRRLGRSWARDRAGIRPPRGAGGPPRARRRRAGRGAQGCGGGGWRGPGRADRRGRRRGGRGGGGGGRASLRPARRLGQQRDGFDLRAPQGDDARGVPAGDRGHLPGDRPRHDGRPQADAPARPRRHRPGRLRARLPRHPPPGGLLRRQARHPGLQRVAARRTAPRRERGPRDDGAAAGAEHAAVRLGQEPPAEQSATGAADLPARAGRRRDRLGGRPRPARGQRRRLDRHRPPRQQVPAGLRRLVPRQDRLWGTADRRAGRSEPPAQPLGAG
ncbi:MAG: 3-oxoacyl-[acyl-carrier protein] reductase, partial [uncultured Thermomicrobiales bacterium]